MCIILADRRSEPSASPDLSGCAFILDGTGPSRAHRCSAPVHAGSAYCPTHHALCHLPAGSAAERRQLREIAALAKAVGGKQGRAAATPPPLLLGRLKRIEQAFTRSHGS
jgi:hypothetical protein